MSARRLLALVAVAVVALAAVVLASEGSERRGAAPEPSGAAKEASFDPVRFSGSVLPPGVRAPDFELRNQDGDPISMRSLRGRAAIVTFLYARCEESCPPQAQQIKGALAELGRDVPAIAISVDPPHDTPAAARHFLAEQGMTGKMAFALGSRAELEPLWKAYAVQPQARDVEHQSRIVLVDRRGFQRVAFSLDKATPERLAHDLRALAAE